MLKVFNVITICTAFLRVDKTYNDAHTILDS